MTIDRAERVAELVKDELSHIIMTELRDPRVGFITITGVKMSPDLRHTKIYFSTLGDKGERERTIAGLKQATGFLRRELGHRLRLRYCPTLSFYFDTSIEYGAHIDQLLQRLKKN